jgi:nucleotide-binding universal stress UspA family protein
MKDLVVHLDGSAADSDRLSYAGLLATMFGSHLTGLFTLALPDIGALATPDAAVAAASLFADLEAGMRARADDQAPRIASGLQASALTSDLLRVDGRMEDVIRQSLTSLRCADLFIATTPYRDGEGALWDGLTEAALFASGRGTLLVPPGYRTPDAIRGVLIAWNDTREAARAVAEALPLISRASKVDVVLVDAETDAAASDLARYLDRHGAKVTVACVASAGRSVAETILTEARRQSSDLIVMGGYGHSRLREWVMGGTTLDVLQTSTVPLLIAH